MSKPKPIGPPLQASDAELDALSTVTDADIDAAIAHWLANAPDRAKGLLLAQPVDVLNDAETTTT